MRNALLLTLNSLKITFRKKGNIIVYLFLPIIGILVSMAFYGSAGSGSVNVGIYDEDKTTISTDMIKSLEKQGKFKISYVEKNDINQKVTSGKLDCVLEIPVGFEQGIYKNNPKEVRILSIKGESVTVWIKNYMNLYIGNLVSINEASGGNKDTFIKIYNGYKEEKLTLKVNKLEDQYTGKAMTSQSLGFLIMFMMLGAGFTSEMILKEKRSRTYFRICASPVKVWTYISSNVLTSLTMIFIQIVFILLIMTKIFRINTFVPAYQLMIILVIFGFVAAGIGLLVVAFAIDSIQAGTLQTLIVTPTCMLGGCFWPAEMMPKAVQRIADFMPQKWALECIRKLQTGSSFNEILLYPAIILAFAAAFFLIAAYKFSRNNSISSFV